MKPVLCIATGQSCVRLLPLGDGVRGDIWSAPWLSVEMLQAARIHRLATRAGSSREVYAASWGEGLWFSRDGGRRWSNAPIEIRGSRVHCVGVGSSLANSDSGSGAASERAEQVLVGSEHGVLKRARPDARGDLRSWEMLDNLWLVPSSSSWSARPNGGTIRDVAVNPRHEEWLLAAVEGAGVLFSSDGGFSWDDARANTDPATRRLLWHPEHAARALALSLTQLRASDDGGWNWRDAASPLAYLHAATPLVDGDGLSQSGWLVAGHNAGVTQIWRGESERWQMVKQFPDRTASAHRIEALLIAPGRSSEYEVWLAGWSDGAIEVSRDQGRSWRALLIEGAPIAAALDIVLAQTSDEEDEDEAAQGEEGEGKSSDQKKAGSDERHAVRFTEDEEIL